MNTSPVSALHQQAVMTATNEAAIRWPAHAERIAKASELLLAESVERIDSNVYRVWSQSDPLVSYLVTRTSCECPDRMYRSHRACKHMVACRLISYVTQVKAELLARETPDPKQWPPEQAKRLQFARWLVQNGRIAA